MLVEQSTEGGSLLQGGRPAARGGLRVQREDGPGGDDARGPRWSRSMPSLTVEEAADEVARGPAARAIRCTPSRSTRSSGVVHAKDILTALRARPHGDRCATIMRPPLFVPGHPRGRGRAGRHEAAQDPPGGGARRVRRHRGPGDDGGPAGGDRRARSSTSTIRRTGPAPPTGAALLDGAMPISEFNSEYDAALDDADYTTIGGYVFGQLGRLPRPGDRVTVGPAHLRGGGDGGPAGEEPAAAHRAACRGEAGRWEGPCLAGGNRPSTAAPSASGRRSSR